MKTESVRTWLVLCGETIWGREARLHGSTDLPLTTSGRTMVQAHLADHDVSNISMVYHAPDEAAADTAAIVSSCANGAKCKLREALADPALGLLEGLTVKVFAERFPKRYKQWQEDPLRLSPPEGESFADARQRLLSAFVQLLERSQGKEIAVVVHRISLGFIRCWAASRPTSEMWDVLDEAPLAEKFLWTPELIELLRQEIASAGVAG